jgi:hypothetical protein
MKIKETPRAGSYEAALTEEQRISLYALLLSGITLAEAREKALRHPTPALLHEDNSAKTLNYGARMHK